ncbi:hypothetical protein EPK99_19825 [Neorhizobium lilium]|uniref:Uncharacterized protein n=1 Tax=Neorhizobium lilium TaxID=2503024 RepID=A0A444LDJ3_9HYPH|nr:hypothetical protein [Neorhizobium lilium]RWX75926.1 hypothetical protein EPK99_19825 [Neorhizobium lilium]
MRQAIRSGQGSSASLRALCLATTVILSVSAAGAAQATSPTGAERPVQSDAAQGPKSDGPKSDGQLQQALDSTLPQPAPAIDRPSTATTPDTAPAVPGNSGDGNIPDGPSEIIRDMSALPAPVKKMRDQLIEAAASGDVERLRALVGTGANQTLVMNSDGDDPVDTLKTFSGDPDGQEILAIMIDILSTGAARFDAGKPDEVYVWPYFVAKNVESLTPPERVDLLRIVTAGDLIGMQENGNYNFYRIGITPNGQWKFLTGGD